MKSASLLRETPGRVPPITASTTATIAASNDGLTLVAGSEKFITEARAVASVAMAYAAEVDKAARFPVEAVAALREHRLLSASVPKEFGGGGATLAQVAAICRILGEACSSTAMIYAMHQSQLSCVIEHAPNNHWFRGFMEDIVWNQRLIASATSEETIGGNLRASACAIAPDEQQRFRLSKKTPTISYGAHADAILVTARRHADAKSSDQVLVVILREDLSLVQTSEWDTLGMRGTGSCGFMLEAHGGMQQVFETPFSDIASETMVPVSHVCWSSAWLGIATDAIRRGQKLFRKQVRADSPSVGQSGARLAEAFGTMRMMTACIDAAIASYDRQQEGRSEALSFGSALEMNDLKIRMSQSALKIIEQMMQLCGMAAYKNDSPFSLGRHFRDLHSAPIMINNDRLIASMSVLMMAERVV